MHLFQHRNQQISAKTFLVLFMHRVDSHPGADLVQTGGDGFGRGVTAEHMTF